MFKILQFLHSVVSKVSKIIIRFSTQGFRDNDIITNVSLCSSVSFSTSTVCRLAIGKKRGGGGEYPNLCADFSICVVMVLKEVSIVVFLTPVLSQSLHFWCHEKHDC